MRSRRQSFRQIHRRLSRHCKWTGRPILFSDDARCLELLHSRGASCMRARCANGTTLAPSRQEITNARSSNPIRTDTCPRGNRRQHPDGSVAEKQSPQVVKQFCATAGGVFFIESNGTYSCSYPTVRGITTYKNCNAGGDCEYVDYCGGVICGRTPVAGNGKGRRPKDPQPSKLEGPTTVTAGTIDDRGGRAAIGGPVTNTALGGGNRSGAVAGPAMGAPQSSAPAESKIAQSAPIPAQLSERLGRLQRPR